MDFGFLKRKADAKGAAAAPLGPALVGADIVRETTTAGFTADVLQASQEVLVVVDFWSPRSPVCKQLTPILEKVVRSYGGRARLVKLNIDDHPAIAGQLRVQTIPTVYAFRDGRPLDGFAGASTEAQVRAFLDRLLAEAAGADIGAVLAAAEEAIAAEDLPTAAELFAGVLHIDKQNPVALAGLARVYLVSGDLARAEATLAVVPPDKRSETAVVSTQAAIDLAKLSAMPDQRAEFEARLAADPADHQARLELAVATAARGDKEKALDLLLEIVRRNRTWNEDAARKQLVQLFEAWGPKDPLTLEGRRRLSSILFS